MIYLKKVIENILETYQFRMNNAETRELLSDLVSFELQKIKDNGGAYNVKVVCDETNNTPDIIQRGELVLDYFIDPSIPYRVGNARAVIVKTGDSFDTVKI